MVIRILEYNWTKIFKQIFYIMRSRVYLFKLVTIIVSSALLQGCSDSVPKSDQSTVVKSNRNDSEKETSERTKTESEVIIDAGTTLLETGAQLLKTKRLNDSIRLAKREKMFAYQLGVPLKSEKLVIEAYGKLSNVDGVCALRKSRNEYLLIKYEDKSEKQLDEDLESYKSEHAGEIMGEVRKVDLVKECGKRKKPILSGRISKRKGNVQIDCLTCDN